MLGNEAQLKRKLISVDENTYLMLKRLGQTGDSFNDVLKIILEKHAARRFTPVKLTSQGRNSSRRSKK